jgi:hypothetical protein
MNGELREDFGPNSSLSPDTARRRFNWRRWDMGIQRPRAYNPNFCTSSIDRTTA